MLSKHRVQIVPMGFEIDRVAIPLNEYKCERAWFILSSEETKKINSYLNKIKKQVRKLNCEFKEVICDRNDLFALLQEFRKIIEKEAHNQILINVSAGNKIEAIAGTMATMMFRESADVKAFYVIPQKYNLEPEVGEPLTKGKKEVVELPNYKVDTPAAGLRHALQFIGKNKEGIKQKRLIEECRNAGIIKISDDSKHPKNAEYMSLRQNVLSPLNSWNLVKVEGKRTKTIQLTEDGQNILKIFLTSLLRA